MRVKLVNAAEYVGVMLSIVGTLAVASGNLWGQVAWLIGNPLMVVVAISTKRHGMVLLFAVYSLIAVYGVGRLILAGL